MTITHGVEWLTPEDANRLLDKNTHNRPLSQGDILKWATEMEAGNWQLNGEAIKIDVAGRILDGQHRLHALALQSPGTRIQFLVVRGLKEETQKTMDQGRKRSLDDQLNLEGVDADKSVASAIRLLRTHELGLLFRSPRVVSAQVTTPSLVTWAADNPDAMDLVRAGVRYHNAPLRRGILGMVYALVALEHGSDIADDFFGRLADGVDLQEGSPILALRNRLFYLRTGGSDGFSQKITDRDLIGMTISTFNSWVTGRRLTKIQRPPGGTWNESSFPEVVSDQSLRRSRTMRAIKERGRH